MQVFVDDQGNRHEFPDDATPEEIDAATRSGTAVPPTANPAAGPSPSETTGQPSFMSQLLTNIKNTGQRSYDELRAFNRGISLGLWDDAVGSINPYSSPALERQKTAESKARLPLGGAIPETAGTAALTTGANALVPGILSGGVLNTAGTSALLSGIQSEADQDSPGRTLANMGVSGILGTGLHGLTSAASGVGKWLTGTKAPAAVESAADTLNQKADSEWDSIKSYFYPRQALHDINEAAQADAKNRVNQVSTGRPLTTTSEDKATSKLFDKFDDRFRIEQPVKGQKGGTAGTPVWPSEVDKWRNDALALGTSHGDALAARLENLMQNGPTFKLAPMKSVAEPMTPELAQQNTDTVYNGILSARNAKSRADAASALAEAQKKGTNTPITSAIHDTPNISDSTLEILKQADKGTPSSNIAARVNAVLPNVAATTTTGLGSLLGLRLGSWEPALVGAGSGLVMKPVIQSITKPIANAARNSMLQSAQDQLLGAVRPRPDTSAEDAFRRMLLGTWLSQQ